MDTYELPEEIKKEFNKITLNTLAITLTAAGLIAGSIIGLRYYFEDNHSGVEHHIAQGITQNVKTIDTVKLEESEYATSKTTNQPLDVAKTSGIRPDDAKTSDMQPVKNLVKTKHGSADITSLKHVDHAQAFINQVYRVSEQARLRNLAKNTQNKALGAQNIQNRNTFVRK